MIDENNRMKRRLRDWSWFFIIFFLLMIGYLRSYGEFQKKQEELDHQVESLQERERLVKQEWIELQEQLASQNDPEWIKLTLMRCLGVVPKGYTKVYFLPDELNHSVGEHPPHEIPAQEKP